MSSDDYTYQLRNISKSYSRGGETVKVLDQLNLDVKKGEFISIMGPSGTGKSTFFNILGGLDNADQGEVVFEGRDIRSLKTSQLDKWRARHIGFVFQFYHLIPVFNAIQNVELPLLLTSLSSKQRKEKVKAALSLVGLEGREKHYPNQLSGGQQQRVAIARAIVTDPAVILADELTGDLDAQTAEDIAKIVLQLNRDFQKTIIIFTHDQKIAQIGNRTLHMESGKIRG